MNNEDAYTELQTKYLSLQDNVSEAICIIEKHGCSCKMDEDCRACIVINILKGDNNE